MKIISRLKQLAYYYKKGGLKGIRLQCSLLWGYVKDILRGKYRGYKVMKLILIVAALLYLVSPIDFIADFLPAGLVDDVAILGWALSELSEELSAYRLWKETLG